MSELKALKAQAAELEKLEASLKAEVEKGEQEVAELRGKLIAQLESNTIDDITRSKNREQVAGILKTYIASHNHAAEIHTDKHTALRDKIINHTLGIDEEYHKLSKDGQAMIADVLKPLNDDQLLFSLQRRVELLTREVLVLHPNHSLNDHIRGMYK